MTPPVYTPQFPAAPLAFGTKAKTLYALRGVLRHWIVPELWFFTVQDWTDAPDSVLSRIREGFPDREVIVRSSARAEDGAEGSLAGGFTSVASLPSGSEGAVRSAIDQVIASYGRDGNQCVPEDEILVQEMVSESSMSGVVFTQDLSTGAPYFVINYDDETGRTDTVTSGGAYSNRTLLVHRGSVDEVRSERFKALLRGVEELESVTGSRSLDIEFAMDEDHTAYLLQVRRITTQPNWNRGITLRVNDAIARVATFAESRNRLRGGILGSRSILGQMPDWNPAEMIGTTPRPLSLSLYQNLITDRAWRLARAEMGYREPKGMPLMVSLAGQPFVDVRLSFNSYLPADLAPNIGGKLVDAWLDRLEAHPHLHDKVEFDVAITMFAFDFEQRYAEQCGGVLSEREQSEFRESLQRVTRDLVTGRRSPIAQALAKVESLASIRNAHAIEPTPSIAMVAELLEDCHEFGTIPFSVLARHGFIGVGLLRSLAAKGVLDQEGVEAFQRSVPTVAGELVEMMNALGRGETTPDQFKATYGHLRPGTYDILSIRYDQRSDLTGRLAAQPPREVTAAEFTLTDSQRRKIDALLEETDLGVDADGLLEYIRQAIQGREYAKLVFTRNVSDALEIIASWGEGVGLSRSELSYLRIQDVLDALSVASGRTLEQHLREASERGRGEHEVTKTIRLPQLLTSPDEVHVVPLLLHSPNFITRGRAHGQIVRLESRAQSPPDLTDRIVLIDSADPGFDWIFSERIAGLVTKFGGTNSHMAIRCAEFGIPAAIGCGEQVFDRLLHSRSLELDCAVGSIVPVEA
jgi:phosphohistidine swiveling domain-containing protein